MEEPCNVVNHIRGAILEHGMHTHPSPVMFQYSIHYTVGTEWIISKLTTSCEDFCSVFESQ